MDLQLNISYSNKDNKKKSSVSKNDNKDYKFISKPKLEGKVLARKRQHQKDSTEEPHNKVPKFKKPDSKDDEVSTNLLDLSQNKGKFKGKNFQDLNDDIKIKKVQSGTWISSLFKNNPDVPRMGQRAVKPLVEKVFSGNSFSDLEIHPHSVANLSQNLGLKELMTVQQQAVPIILQGRDVLIRSQTGSGKTLSYALPIVEGLQAIRPKINRNSGIKAVVVVPTRELAVQTFELFVKLVKPFTWIVPGLLSGGQKRKAEKARLRKGLCILVGTPGRINDHLRHTQSLNFAKAGCLVLDEADRLLDMGYEKDVAAIIKAIEDHKKAATYDPMALVRGNAPKKIINNDDDNDGDTSSKKIANDDVNNDGDTSSKEVINEKNEKTHRLTEFFLSTHRQTTLLSATLTKAVENLAGLTMVDPVFVDTSEGRAIVADSLKQQPEATKSKKKKKEVPSDTEPEKVSKEKSSKNKLHNEENDEEERRGGLKPFRGAVMHPELFSTEVKNNKTEQSNSDSDSDYEYYKNEKEILENANKLESSESENKVSDSGFSEALKSAVIEDELILPATVNQSFLIVPMKLRLVTLCSLIVQHCVLNKKGGKMIVFMATLEMVDYHSDLIETVLSGEGSDKKSNKIKNKKSNKTNEDKSSDESESEFHIDYEAPAEGGIVPVDIEMFKLHGSMPHEQRMEVFKQFRVARSGVLICTDVAARGIDVPHVDLVLQYCAPASATDYVHRVGRTGRAARVGEAIMFLLPSETEFVRYLEEKRIRLRQMNESNCLECLRSVAPTALSTQRAAIAVQARLEHVAHGNRDWLARASRAYTSWVRFYSGYPRDVREYLDSKGLHLGHAAKAFALRETPAMLAKRAKLDPNLKKERPTNKLTVHEDEEAKRPGIPVAKLPKFGLPRYHNKQSSMHTASEFDSGLDAIDTGKPAKKKKKNK